MRQADTDGDENFARHIADGHVDLYLRDIDHMTASASTWQQYVVD
ncbi:hypothetical protein ACFRCW_34225 [Streptomyces sp. NPDC056653]